MKSPRDFARAQRRSQSRAERLLWDLVRDRGVAGAKFRRQHPIAPYTADFACVEAMVIVEVDGLSHTIDVEIERDAQRSALLQAQGWRVLRIDERDVLADVSAIARRIEGALLKTD